MVWTRFMDMHSGGRLKEKWQYIYIEAPQDEAIKIFYSKFGHNPERVTCTCCGDDYSISESPTFTKASAFDRNAVYAYKTKKPWAKMTLEEKKKYGKTAKYVDPNNIPEGYYRHDSYTRGKYMTEAAYKKSPDIRVISKKDIAPSDLKVNVPEQGYVWQD